MPELRKDPIIDNWVIISTERGRRPLDYKIILLLQISSVEEILISYLVKKIEVRIQKSGENGNE